MVALTCEALGLDGDERVLDVGTGSGYAAAVLAELAAEVHTIERIPELADTARAALAAAGYERVQVHVGDGALGLPEFAPVRRDRRRRGRPGGAGRPLGAARERRPDRAAAADRARRTSSSACSSGRRTGRGSLATVPGPLRSARSAAKAVTIAAVMPLLASDQQWPCSRTARCRRFAGRPTGSSSRSSASSAPAATSSTSASTRCCSRGSASTTWLRPPSRSSSPRAGTTGGTATGRSAQQRGHFGYQGMRFFVVSGLVYLANLGVLTLLVSLGVGKVAAQAVAIVLVTPLNFLGNKLWSFRR